MYQMNEKSGLDCFDMLWLSSILNSHLKSFCGDTRGCSPDLVSVPQGMFQPVGFPVSFHAIVAGREHFQHWETWMISFGVAFAHLLRPWMIWAQPNTAEKARSSRGKLLNGHTQECPFCQCGFIACMENLFRNLQPTSKSSDNTELEGLYYLVPYWCWSATPTVRNVRSNPSNIHWVHGELRLGS